MVKWPLEHFAELIAWLDYSLSHEGITFSDTIVGHLKDTCDSEYTFERVERKLRSIWTIHGPKNDPLYTWKDLYEHGSKILSRLTAEEVEAVDRAYAKLEDRAIVTLLSAREQPRTRSASKSDSFRFSPHISLETVQMNQSPPYRKRRQTGSATPCPTKRESEPVELALYEGLTPRKKGKRSSPLKPTIPPDENQPTEEQPIVSEATATSTQRDISHSDVEHNVEREDRIETEKDEHNEKISKQGFSSETHELLSSDTDSEPEDSTVEDSLDEENRKFTSSVRLRTATERLLKERLDAVTTQMQAVRHELNHKQSQLKREEERAKKLQIQKGQLQSAQRERDFRSGEPLEELIRRKDLYIDKLKGLLEDREKLGFFVKSFQAPPTKRLSMPLDEDLKDIYSQCQHIPCQYDSNRPLFVPVLDRYDDLRSLVCRGLGIEPHDNSWAEKVNVDFSKLTTQAIVRAITTSALREWIFENDFPRLQNTSELLRKYRENIASLDGALALRNLDLAAHSSIINSDQFQNHRIPRNARKLARRLSKALAPFFVKDPNHPKESDWHGFNKWGQKREEYEERQANFENICKSALRTKANSILNLEDYQMVIYPPGTEFEITTMEVENMGGIPQRKGHFEGRVIMLCIQAAVFAYPRRDFSDDITRPMAEAVVQFRNFSHTGKGQREGGRLLIPARVILMDEQLVVRSSVSDTMSEGGTSGHSDISTPTDS